MSATGAAGEREPTRVREMVEAWQRAGPDLEQVRRARIRATDTGRDLQAFAGLAAAALRAQPSPVWSGLIDQQAWYSRLRPTSPSDDTKGAQDIVERLEAVRRGLQEP